MANENMEVEVTPTTVEEPQQQQQTNEGDVSVTTNSNMEVDIKPESTDSSGNTTTEDNNNKPEPTGQEVDNNIQQRIDNQQQADNDLKKDLETKGINWDDLSKEYEEKGDLSEQTRASLEKAGYPKTVVDAYIRGMEAEYEMLANRVIEYGGGQDNFVKIQNFVKTQSPEYQQMWNDTINTGNLMSIKTMLSGVQADMVRVYGTQGTTIMGSGSQAGTGITGFSSKDEMITAMSDPRYGKDKAYTRSVEQKVITSKLF